MPQYFFQVETMGDEEFQQVMVSVQRKRKQTWQQGPGEVINEESLTEQFPDTTTVIDQTATSSTKKLRHRSVIDFKKCTLRYFEL